MDGVGPTPFVPVLVTTPGGNGYFEEDVIRVGRNDHFDFQVGGGAPLELIEVPAARVGQDAVGEEATGQPAVEGLAVEKVSLRPQ